MADNNDSTAADDKKTDGGQAPENTNSDSSTAGAGTEPDKKTETAGDPKGGEKPSGESDEAARQRAVIEKLRKENKQLADEKSERERKELEAKGEHEKIANQEREKREQAEKRYQTAVKDNKLAVAASAAGIKDVDAALKLVDRSDVQVDDDGKVTGAEEAIKALVEEKPYLTSSTTKTPVGSGTSPSSDGEGGGGDTPPVFTEKQIEDPEFFRKHEKEIMQAHKNGRIVKDDAAAAALLAK